MSGHGAGVVSDSSRWRVTRKSGDFQRILELDSSTAAPERRAFDWPGSQAIGGSVERVAETPESLAASQNVVQNGTDESTPASATQESPAGEASIDEHPGLVRLKEILALEGIGDGAVKLRYFEQEVIAPLLGGWTNRNIEVECANGRRMTFSADLTERTPQVTLWDIQMMVNGIGDRGVDEPKFA